MKRCALIIGHKKTAPGAVNKASGLTEFVFNDDLAKRIEGLVKGVEVIKVYRNSYRGLVNKVNSLKPDFIISLHCNAFNEKASGTEMLYYQRSTLGMKMAIILQLNITAALGLPDRRAKGKSVEERGGYLLRYTKAPCVIAEPFFIDNDSDLAVAQSKLDELAQAYADSIEEITQVI